MATRLTGAMLLVRDVSRAVAFFGERGLGLSVLRQSEEVAQLGSSALSSPHTHLKGGMESRRTSAHEAERESPPGAAVLTLQAVAAGSEAPLSVGFTPMLTFEIEDMDVTVPRLLQMGAHLDGAIKYAPHGKVASMRAPDGVMIGLYEPSA
jgi:predicted enzyme related to lactoylglutathione lyase